MDQNNMYQQENFGVQSAEQTQNPYMAPMQPQPAYQPPVESEDVSMGEWMWTLLLLYIPIVNIILMLVWAFGGGTKASKANFCKAQLIWTLIFFVLYIIMIIAIFSLGISAANSLLHNAAVSMPLL